MTPKFNDIALDFMQRIQDPITIVSNTIIGGSIITSVTEIESYINQAMFKLFNDNFVSAKGDKRLLTKIFPELVKTGQINISYVGDLSQGILSDFIKDAPIIIDIISDNNTYLEEWKLDKLSIAISQENPFYIATSSRPAYIEVGDYLYVFPANYALSGIKQFDIIYLQQPLDPNGGHFVSGGIYDSPFTVQWNPIIAEIAEKIYKIKASIISNLETNNA